MIMSQIVHFITVFITHFEWKTIRAVLSCCSVSTLNK